MKGFTLVEVMITATIVLVMSSISIPIFKGYQEKANLTAAASDLKNFEVAFQAYLIDNETLPDDTHIVLPTEMQELIPEGAWGETPLGGTYNWEGPDSYPYAGIAFFEPTVDFNTFLALDRMIDDGDLFSGKFIIGTNGRYVYTIG